MWTALVLLLTAYDAPPPPPANDLQALIAEVRTLRSALDRTTFLGLRVQLVLHRLGQQQQVVHLASTEAQGFEEQGNQLRFDLENTRRSIDGLESRKRQAARDANGLQDLEQQLTWSRQQLEALPKMIQEIETSRMAAQQNLRNERAKLEDLQRQLDELEVRLQELSKP